MLLTSWYTLLPGKLSNWSSFRLTTANVECKAQGSASYTTLEKPQQAKEDNQKNQGYRYPDEDAQNCEYPTYDFPRARAGLLRIMHGSWGGLWRIYRS